MLKLYFKENIISFTVNMCITKIKLFYYSNPSITEQIAVFTILNTITSENI